MPRADLWFSLLLIALGAGVVVESYRMPRFEELGVNPLTAPGLTPGMIGAVLFVLGALLLLRSIRKLPGSGQIDTRARVSKASGDNGVGRTCTALALTLGYAGVLVGRVPFWLATAVFVFVFSSVFELMAGARRGRWLLRAGLNALLGVVVASAVVFVFQDIFLVRLP